MIKKAMTATLAAVLTLGIAGVVQTSQLNAAQPTNPGKSETKDTEKDSEKNQASYWQAQYPGSTCTKSNPGGTVFEVPTLPSNTVYAAIIVKAGSEASVGDPNKVYESPKAGDKLTAPEGKNISHVIVCTRPAGGSGGGTTPTTPTNPGTTVGGSGTAAPVTSTPAPAASAPVASGQGSVVSSLPVTSGSSAQIAGLSLLSVLGLAASAAYVIRSRSGLSL